MVCLYFIILAHPTGRRIDERAPYDVDIERVMNAALERGCFPEINAYPDFQAGVHPRTKINQLGEDVLEQVHREMGKVPGQRNSNVPNPTQR